MQTFYTLTIFATLWNYNHAKQNSNRFVLMLKFQAVPAHFDVFTTHLLDFYHRFPKSRLPDVTIIEYATN